MARDITQARDITHRLTCALPVCPTCGRTGRSRAWIGWALLSILLLVAIQVVFTVLYGNVDVERAQKAPAPLESAPLESAPSASTPSPGDAR